MLQFTNMDHEQELKKTRVANFSSTDRSILLKLTNSFNSIIESKKTDAITWREKKEAWKKIEFKFNSCTTGAPRTEKQLKYKYDSIKKELKKRHTQHMSYIKGTGGGPYVPPPPPHNEDEKALAETIALSIQGLHSKYDSDALAGVSGMTMSTEKDMNVDDEEVTYVDWTQPHAKLLQTQVHPVLRSEENNVEHDGEFELELETSQVDCPVTDHVYSKSLENDQVGKISTSAPITTEMREETFMHLKNKATENKSRNQMKTGTWQSRRRPIIAKSKTVSSAGAKFEIVAEKKCELLEIEKEIALEKKEQNRKEHDLKMRLLRGQEEEQIMKNEILRQRLNKDTTQ